MLADVGARFAPRGVGFIGTEPETPSITVLWVGPRDLPLASSIQ